MRGILFIACFISICSCQKEINTATPDEPDYPVFLRFIPVVGTEDLEPGTTYQNSYGESFTVSAFKFYLHDVQLVNTTTGNTAKLDKDSYHLLDLMNNQTALVPGIAKIGSFDAISFIIGVDSIYNVSGAQDGALDPLNGMFWTWNTGYVMAKLEGNSPVAATPNNAFEYHIGGFGGEQNVVKRITIPTAAVFNPANFQRTEIKIECDVLSWFEGANEISLSQNPVCMTPGELAKKIAANYYNMFRFSSIADAP